jgi:hypothetical protein
MQYVFGFLNDKVQQLIPCSTIILGKLTVTNLINDLLACIEPDVSSHCSQQPSTTPKPRKMNPFHTLTPYFPQTNFNLILPSTARLIVTKTMFPSLFSHFS